MRTGVDGNVGLRELRVEFVVELLLAIGAIEMLEITACVVARAIFEFYVLYVGATERDLEMTEAAILHGIRAGETKNIVGGRIFLHLCEDAAEIVGVEKGFAAGVVGERRKRFLGIRVAVEVVEDGVAVVGGLAVQAGVLRF